jgi:hypothetical protein
VLRQKILFRILFNKGQEVLNQFLSREGEKTKMVTLKMTSKGTSKGTREQSRFRTRATNFTAYLPQMATTAVQRRVVNIAEKPIARREKEALEYVVRPLSLKFVTSYVTVQLLRPARRCLQ